MILRTESERLSCQVNVKGPFLELRTDKPSREILSRSSSTLLFRTVEYSVGYRDTAKSNYVNADKNTEYGVRILEYGLREALSTRSTETEYILYNHSMIRQSGWTTVGACLTKLNSTTDPWFHCTLVQSKVGRSIIIIRRNQKQAPSVQVNSVDAVFTSGANSIATACLLVYTSVLR